MQDLGVQIGLQKAAMPVDKVLNPAFQRDAAAAG
jgi:hypothetical protein